MNKELLEELKLLIEDQVAELAEDEGLTVEGAPNQKTKVYKNLGYGGFRKRRLPNADEQGY